MDLTRRDMFKLGALGVVGTAGASQLPWSSVIEARAASLLAAERQTAGPSGPGSCALRSSARTGAGATADGVWTDYFTVTESARRARILPTMSTQSRATTGCRPGRRSRYVAADGPSCGWSTGCRRGTPRWGRTPPRRCTCTVRRRSPSSTGTPATSPGAGGSRTTEYPNSQPARTLWYHDHGVHHTAQNAYAGLYAQYHLHDRAEQALLPQGEFDVPLMVGDALFTARGQLTIGDDESGLWGDVILVNGRPWPVMKVKRRIYRFRFLVASISRSYRFQLGNGDPVTMVATDGGLMPRARQVSQWRQSSAERYEVLIDFRRYRAGQRVVLRNLSNDNNRDFANTDQVMAFDVTDAPFSKRDHTWNHLPDTLVDSPVMRLKPADAPDPTAGGGAHRWDLDDQRPDLGRRGRQRLPAGGCQPEARTPPRSGSSPIRAGAGSTPSTSTWSTSGSSPATAGRRSTTSAARRTPPTSVRERRCG